MTRSRDDDVKTGVAPPRFTAALGQPPLRADADNRVLDAAVRSVHPRSVVDTPFTADKRWGAAGGGLTAPNMDAS